jgi:hypothetical protein
MWERERDRPISFQLLPPPATTTRWIGSEVFAILVGVRGLEPPTSASRTLRASRLRYTPVLTIRASDSLALSSEPYYA